MVEIMIKTFRGLLADNGQDQIRLSTIKGKVGYRIVKFELMPPSPGAAGQESVVKIYSQEQTSVTGTIDFTQSQLLAAAFGSTMTGEPSVHPQTLSVIFDREMFNQDIFITHVEINGSVACNYYLELEVIPLDDAGAEYTTLKDMRQS
jgi:hypothetical protein